MKFCGRGQVCRRVVILDEETLNTWIVLVFSGVVLSRVKPPDNLAIINPSTSLCISDLKKIGKNKTNEKIKSF